MDVPVPGRRRAGRRLSGRPRRAAAIANRPDACSADAPYRALVSTYCVSCHNSKVKAGGLALDAINTQELGAHHEAWEKVALKLRAHQMPPPGARRPDEASACRRVDIARSGARRPVRDRSESGPDRYVPPAEPHGISQRDPRSAGAGCRGRRRCCRAIPRASDSTT